METTKYGQTFFREEADAMFPAGCRCVGRAGDCDWCGVYYDGAGDIELPNMRNADALPNRTNSVR